eukprot:m.168876 g.168876  ORF g.168876 m.168876 type:complete len:174 (+) comp25091_c0_seq3:320-841(+)
MRFSSPELPLPEQSDNLDTDDDDFGDEWQYMENRSFSALMDDFKRKMINPNLRLFVESEIGDQIDLGCLGLSINSCVVALFYLDKHRHRPSLVEFRSTHSGRDTLLIACLAAHKFMADDGDNDAVDNDTWASLCKKTLTEVNQLELDFCCAIDWNFFVDAQEFHDFIDKLQKN